MQIQLSFDTKQESPVFVKAIIDAMAVHTSEGAEAQEPAKESKKKKEPKKTIDIHDGADIMSPSIDSHGQTPPLNTAEFKKTFDGEFNDKPISLEEVRAVVDPKITAGKQKELRALFEKYDATKVTTLHPDHYAAFIEDVKAIV